MPRSRDPLHGAVDSVKEEVGEEEEEGERGNIPPLQVAFIIQSS